MTWPVTYFLAPIPARKQRAGIIPAISALVMVSSGFVRSNNTFPKFLINLLCLKFNVVVVNVNMMIPIPMAHTNMILAIIAPISL